MVPKRQVMEGVKVPSWPTTPSNSADSRSGRDLACSRNMSNPPFIQRLEFPCHHLSVAAFWLCPEESAGGRNPVCPERETSRCVKYWERQIGCMRATSALLTWLSCMDLVWLSMVHMKFGTSSLLARSLGRRKSVRGYWVPCSPCLSCGPRQMLFEAQSD